MVSQDYFERVALGKVKGHTQYFKFAVNEDIDVAEDILSQGGDVQILDANETCTIVSDNANDTSAGTGTQQVSVFGAKRNSNGTVSFETELVTLNGITPVNLVNSYIAIWRMRSVRAGANRKNVGVITITSSSTALLGQIEINKGSSLTSLMVVPDGYTMLLYDFFTNIGVVAGSSVVRKATVTVRLLNYITNAETVEGQVGLRDEYGIEENFRLPLEIPENNFVWVRADYVENNGTAISAAYNFELIKNVSN